MQSFLVIAVFVNSINAVVCSYPSWNFHRRLRNQRFCPSIENTHTGSSQLPALTDIVIQERCGIPIALQRLRHGVCDVCEETDVHRLFHGDTVTLLLRLPGGKGGFGSLLRVQGRDTKATTNFEACRDLNGRRMRHVNSVKKMQEWHKNAQERELEDIALKHIVKRSREAKRAKRAPIDRSLVQEQQQKTVDDVKAAVQSALKHHPIPTGTEKTAMPRFMTDPDSDTESDDSEAASMGHPSQHDVDQEAGEKLMGKRKRS